MNVVGILLAAGHSRRFGTQNKLNESLPDGNMMAMSSAAHLLQALPCSVAILRANHLEMHEALTNLDMSTVICGENEQEMADSISVGIRQARTLWPEVQGFVIALADMPYISSGTIADVALRLAQGAGIAVPTYQGRRGHPVGFSVRFLEELLALTGDQGARLILQKHPEAIVSFECDDRGILVDIDTQSDLENSYDSTKDW